MRVCVEVDVDTLIPKDIDVELRDGKVVHVFIEVS